MPDLTFSKVATWADAQDPNNIPPGFKLIMAADLLRYENFCDAARAEVNANRARLTTNESAITTLNNWKPNIDTDIAALKALPAVSTKTANYTTVATDRIIIGNGASITITLMSAVVATAGRVFRIKNRHSTTLTVASAAGTIDGAATKTLAQWASADFVSDGTNWYVL